MKIDALEVDGFGVWSGLRLDGLSDGLNVFFGPNEAGKTTLMQFIRSVFYGFSPPRSRYLPPVRGGQPGGSLHLAGPNGHFQLARHQSPDQPGSPGRVTITAADGTCQGEHLLKVLLSNIDEATFNNVFSVGLSELQELGSLGQTEAADMLYRLSVGLDRVPLVDVLRELDGSRKHILRPDGQPCRITALVAQREQLAAEMVQVETLTRNYVRLAADRDQLDRETARLEEENHRLEGQVRVLEIATAVASRWSQRAALDEEIEALGPIRAVPEGAVGRLEMLNHKLAESQRQADDLKRRWQQARDEAVALQINESLWRLAPRIETLQEQKDWISTLQSRLGELATEISQLEGELFQQREQCGWDDDSSSGGFPSISPESLAPLRPSAKAIRRSRRHLAEAQQEEAARREAARSLSDRITADLATRGESNLSEAVDRTAGRVAQLRRREQLDQRLTQMESYQLDLEEQSRRLLVRQVLPMGVILALGILFVAGVVMIGLTLLEWVGWVFALFGSVGVSASLVAKFLYERSAARKLDGCHRQIEMLRTQVGEAKKERDALDERLPGGDGVTGHRLQAAEKELAALEELVPLDSQRELAEEESHQAGQRVREAQSQLAEAGRQWQTALRQQGLPEKLSPKQVRDMAGRWGSIGEIQRRLELRREEHQLRRRELDAFNQRIVRLTADVELEIRSTHPLERLEELAAQLKQQETQLGRRQALRGQCRQLRRERARYEKAINKIKRRRRDLLRSVDAEDEHQFRRRVARHAEAASLGERRAALDGEIEAAIAGHCPQKTIALELGTGTVEERGQRLTQWKERTLENQHKLRQRLETRGRLAEQLQTLAEDRSPAVKRLELAMVEKRLQEAIFRWQVRAVACRMLDGVRTAFERDRQPETLQQASGYLERLTGGRYQRVWTPLGEEVLRVDDARGQSFAVELLSQGVREQLFLCLRLSLLSSFARRGALLPMILDDVLVNFDAARAKATATVLRDFAAAGHQMLVFTCHEHIIKLFKSLRVTVNRLPEHGDLDSRSGRAIARETPGRKARRKRRSPESPRKLLAKTAHTEVFEEEARIQDEPPEVDAHQAPPEDESLGDDTAADLLLPLDEDDEEEEREDQHRTSSIESADETPEEDAEEFEADDRHPEAEGQEDDRDDEYQDEYDQDDDEYDDARAA